MKLIRFNRVGWGVSDKQCAEYLSCLQSYKPGWDRANEVHPINTLSHITGMSMLHHAVLAEHEDVVRLLMKLENAGQKIRDPNLKTSRQAQHRDKTPLQLMSCLPRSKQNPRIKVTEYTGSVLWIVRPTKNI